ncbi:hypothetical protein PY093_15770 [Cytobacillus sp. S13-E01]|uniref:hypothetical protein n=1 Tax=Cytobacillus sp. S13-E01 TaxID=3031326 RepID=UPI0023D875E7|nr:hypothetical protein [Cytobacillus sp. S13-E01]MDF0728127.1 hypothetical protein [Cytobacillus sp. S13-E01]
MYYNNYGYPDVRDVKGVCTKYMNYYVLGQMLDGSQVEGIITNFDDDGVIMLVPEEIEAEMTDDRYGGYGGYGGHGGRRRHRRFRRRRYPYSQFVFPFILPFPFYY